MFENGKNKNCAPTATNTNLLWGEHLQLSLYFWVTFPNITKRICLGNGLQIGSTSKYGQDMGASKLRKTQMFTKWGLKSKTTNTFKKWSPKAYAQEMGCERLKQMNRFRKWTLES